MKRRFWPVPQEFRVLRTMTRRGESGVQDLRLAARAALPVTPPLRRPVSTSLSPTLAVVKAFYSASQYQDHLEALPVRGQSHPSSVQQNLSLRFVLPGGNIASNIPHCGCAMSVAGREILGQLQNNLSGSIQRLKALPEHQRHGVNCPLYSQVMHLHEHIR